MINFECCGFLGVNWILIKRSASGPCLHENELLYAKPSFKKYLLHGVIITLKSIHTILMLIIKIYSGQNILYKLAMHVGKPEPATLMLEGEFFMVYAKQMQKRILRKQVLRITAIPTRLGTMF